MLYWGERVDTTKERQQADTKLLKSKLETIRSEYRTEIKDTTKLFDGWDCAIEHLDSAANQQTNKTFIDQMIKISNSCNVSMKSFAHTLIARSIELCKQKPPCKFAAVAMGSLARGETTPYSDLEFLFLVEKKTSGSVKYFRLLAMTIYFLIGNLQETKLKYMNIEELKGFDDKGKNGFKIDGLQPKAGNIPTGNGRPEQKDKFILTVNQLITEYKKIWNNPHPEESKKGDFTAMLGHTVLLYGDEALLEQFESVKHSLTANVERRKATEVMIIQDVTDYDFLPLDELEKTFYKGNLKSAIYRYPSLLIYNLKLLFNIVSTDSWQTLRKLHDRRIISDSFFASLQLLLASAQYIRLAAYLYHDSQNENISFLQQSVAVPDEMKRKSVVWHIPRPLLYHMSFHMIPVKQIIIQNKAKTSNMISSLKCQVKFDKPFTAAKFSYMLQNFSETIRILESLRTPLDDPSHMNLLTYLEHKMLLISSYFHQRLFVKAKQAIHEMFNIPGLTENAKLRQFATSILHQFHSTSFEEMDPDDPHQSRFQGFEDLQVDDSHPLAYFMHYFTAQKYQNIDLEKSEQYYEMSWKAWKSKANHEDATFHPKFLYSKGVLFARKNDYKMALKLAEESLGLYHQLYGSDSCHQEIAYCYSLIANCYVGMEKRSEAIRYNKLAVEILESMDHYNGMLHINIAHIQLRLGRKAEAEKSFRRAQRILSTQPSIDHSSLGDIKKEIGILLKARGDREGSVRYFRAGLDMYDIADHLYYAGKCINELREHQIEISARDILDYSIAYTYIMAMRTPQEDTIENLLLCSKDIYWTSLEQNLLSSRAEAEAYRTIIVSLSLRVIKKWAARNLKIIRIINPDDPMPVYEFESWDGKHFYL